MELCVSDEQAGRQRVECFFFSGFLSWCCSTSVCTHVSVCDPFFLAGRQFPAAVSVEDAEMCQGSAHSTEVQVP